MKLNERIELLEKTGTYFGDIIHAYQNQNNTSDFQKELEIIRSHHKYNGWFTQDNIIHALQAWKQQLSKDNLLRWTANVNDAKTNKSVGIVMAGNIPLVGFHDFLSVYISGHKSKIKLSSQDDKLLPAIITHLEKINPDIAYSVEFVDKIKEVDAVIATGSNNTSRYFHQYFGDMPNIIRKNRTSVAILDGHETSEELSGLAMDLLMYFGMGCRNVSKLYLPNGFDLDKIFSAVYHNFAEIIKHNKYANNYDYYKAIYLLNKVSFLENGMMILKEDKAIHSPVSVVHYEYYDKLEHVEKELRLQQDQLQCVVSKTGALKNEVKPGASQFPELWNYADNVNTLEFLGKLTN